MAKWRYLVVRHFGGSQQRRQTCGIIKSKVQEYGHANILPFVKYEISRGGEYYLGIAIDSRTEEAEEYSISKAREILRDAGIPSAMNPQLSWLVDQDQATTFLRGTLQCESFTTPITYEIEDKIVIPNEGFLLAQYDNEELQPVGIQLADLGQYENLLYWGSAVGGGDLLRFKQACQLLNISTEYGGTWPIIRKLTLLGHIEFNIVNSLRWGIIPARIIEPVDPEIKCFLVGQRTPTLINVIRNTYQIGEDFQLGAPKRINIECDRGLEEINLVDGSKIKNVGCVASKMKQMLPKFDKWVKMLPTWQESDFGRFQIERYDLVNNKFMSISNIFPLNEGVYRFLLEHRGQNYFTLAFFDSRDERWICGDFYGLRFINRNRANLCKAIYYAGTHQLIIPTFDRWPMPYERALVLATGLMPQQFQTEVGHKFLKYINITQEFIINICELLGIKMEIK